MQREPAKSGDERDWISLKSRRLLCVFANRAGLGKAAKRSMNKRRRRRWKQEQAKEGNAQDSPPLD